MIKFIMLLGFTLSIQAQAANIEKVHCSEIFYTGNQIIDIEVKNDKFVLTQQSWEDGRPTEDIVAEGQIGQVIYEATKDEYQIELLEGHEQVGVLIVRELKKAWRMSALKMWNNKSGKSMTCSISKSL